MKIENLNIKKEKDFLPDEYQIKYSVSKNVWSMYLIENFFIKDLKLEIDAQKIDKNNAIWVPITDQTIKEIVNTGRYKKIKIVDTLIDLLKNTNIVNNLQK